MLLFLFVFLLFYWEAINKLFKSNHWSLVRIFVVLLLSNFRNSSFRINFTMEPIYSWFGYYNCSVISTYESDYPPYAWRCKVFNTVWFFFHSQKFFSLNISETHHQLKSCLTSTGRLDFEARWLLEDSLKQVSPAFLVMLQKVRSENAILSEKSLISAVVYFVRCEIKFMQIFWAEKEEFC